MVNTAAPSTDGGDECDEQPSTSVDETCAEVFRWLCRVAGASRAMQVLPTVYRVSRSSPHGDARLTGVDRLCAIGFQLVRDDLPRGELTTLVQAVVQLHMVDSRTNVDIAAVVGLPADAIDDLINDAQSRWRAVHLAEAVDAVLRREEIWLDDALRGVCHDAAGAATRDTADTNAPTTPPSDSLTPARLVSRRVIAGIAAAVVVVAVALVWSARPHSPDAAAVVDVPTTRPSVLSAGLFTRTTAQLSEPGFVLDEALSGYRARGFEFAYAEPDPHDLGWLQLWSEPNSDRVTGRWFTVITNECASISDEITPNSTRIGVGQRNGILTATSDGVLRLRVLPDEGTGLTGVLTISGHGFAAEELANIASLINGEFMSSGSPSDCTGAAVSITQHLPGFEEAIAGLTLRIDRAVEGSSEHELLVGANNRIVYYGGQEPDSFLSVRTTDRDPDSTLLTRYLLPASTDPDAPTNVDHTIRTGDRVITVGAFEDGPTSTSTFIQWDEGHETITINSSRHSLKHLLELAATVRRATAAEWNAPPANDSVSSTVPAPSGETEASPPTSANVPLQPVSTATIANGSTWRLLYRAPGEIALVSASVPGIYREYITIDADHALHEFNTARSMVLVVALPHQNDGQQVRVTVGTTVSVEPLIPVDNNVDLAIFAFEEIGPYHVTLIDSAGADVAVLGR